MAAALARDGLTGPAEVLEGKFGTLNTFALDADPSRLTQDLGTVWHTMKIKIKRFACHANAQVPVSLILDLKAKHSISGDDVARIALAVNEKSLTHHNIPEPTDLAMAQYSVPFNAALALYVDPEDPWVFCDKNVHDPRIRALAKSATLEPMPNATSQVGMATRVRLHLKTARPSALKATTSKAHPPCRSSAANYW